MSRRLIVALSLAILSAAGFSQATKKSSNDEVRVTGRLVSPNDELVNYTVSLWQIAPDGPAVNAETDNSGNFTFLAAPGKYYKISFGAGFKTLPITFTTTGGKDIDVGTIVLEHCPSLTETVQTTSPSPRELKGDLRLEQIFVDKPLAPGSQWSGISLPFSPRVGLDRLGDTNDLPPCWSGASTDRRWEWEGRCSVDFHHFVSLESFVGAKVKSIRVVRYDSHLTPTQVKEEVRKVWLGIFRNASCFIYRSREPDWNIEAVVEFYGGKRGSLVMDGRDVQVQDGQGKRWFLRVLPAGD
jgi:hypothetical protein